MERMGADELVCAAVPDRGRGGDCQVSESAPVQEGAGRSVLLPERAAVEGGRKLEAAKKRAVSRIRFFAERKPGAAVREIGGIPPDCPDYGRTGISDLRLSGGGGVPAGALRPGTSPAPVLWL